HDGHAAGCERCERRDGALGLAARFVDEADRQERTSATQRPRRAIRWRGDMHPIAAGAQDLHGCMEIFRLEVAIESVGEENDLASTFGSPRSGKLHIIPE